MSHRVERSKGPRVASRPAEVIDLRIDSIGVGGDGVGRHNGMVVFVPRTAPGDLARVRAEPEGRLMRGNLIELLEPSQLRVTPTCAHYVGDKCGGCQIQHLSYEAQLDAKGGMIRDSLTRIGRLQVDKPDVEPSDKQWRYRRKLTLALRRREGGGRWIAGLHRFDAPNEIFELRDCPITQKETLDAWSAVLAQQRLLPMVNELRASVRLLPAGFSFTLEGAQEWKTHDQFFAAISTLTELWWKPDGKSRRQLHSRAGAWGEQAGASFTQVNPGVAAKLREWVVSLAAAAKPATAIDAYAGTGDIAVALAQKGIRVTAIEIDRDAARVCASRLPAGSRMIAAPVEQALAKALPADVVILNPPRAGLDARVTEILKPGAESTHLPTAGTRPRAVIYVSCNPATLARDLRRLDSYRVQSVRGFDMFPQTAHVETVCELVARESVKA
jgi:23S rRNA (uracil1939-C5)-methyltransferase